nr:acyltransferase family protein [Ornithinimicrobium cryptoxanthini]
MSPTTTTPPPRVSPPRPSALRGDIEGLRAIAVLMVLAFHVGLPGWSGGFAGVDVFFVISGYLITSQLVREAQRDGRVSLVRFYARRARRLLPAATLVLLATTLAGWWLLPRGRHADLGSEVLAATGYVVNWLLSAREVDYLAEDQLPSLVQHYWSLSVEEQFYVLWPLLIIGVLWMTRQLRLRLLPTLTVVLGALIAASAVWSVVHTAESPGTAYFVTTTRVWELGLGALLVLLTPLLRRLPRWSSVLAAVLGLVGIAATVLAISTSTPWPGSAAGLPTFSTALVIAAGITWQANPVAGLLGLAPMRFLGGISYGLYLWHWPALQFLAELHPEARLRVRLLVALLSVLLAWATLHLVENPIRYNTTLATRPSAALRMAGAAMLTSAVAATALWASAPALEDDSLSGQGGIELIDPASRAEAELRLVREPEAATRHTDSPVPDPAVVDKDISLAYREGCQVTMASDKFKPRSGCWFGDPDGDMTVAVVGDSKMEQWSTALHFIGQAEGWRVKFYTKSACGFVDEGRSDVCHAYNRELSQLLGDGENTPDLIFTSMGQGYPLKAEDSFVRMLQPALDRGAEAVFVSDTPGLHPRGVPQETTSFDCLDSHREDYTDCWSDLDTPNGTPLLKATAKRLDAAYVDMLPWICPDPEALGGCAPVVGEVIVNRQGGHLSGTYVRSLVPLLHHELVRHGVAETPLEDIAWEVPAEPQF